MTWIYPWISVEDGPGNFQTEEGEGDSATTKAKTNVETIINKAMANRAIGATITPTISTLQQAAIPASIAEKKVTMLETAQTNKPEQTSSTLKPMIEAL